MSSEWLQVAMASDVPEDGTLLRRVGDVAVCLYKIRGVVYATANVCTHGEASLADGFIVDGDQIECPFHQGRFHIPTGKATHPPCVQDIETYAVTVRDDAVMLRSEDFASAPDNRRGDPCDYPMRGEPAL